MEGDFMFLCPIMQKPLKTTLPNGLRVILLEKRDAPVVSWNLWANVGSVNETDETAGICHLIEHMIFKGTSRRPVGQIAKEVEAAGGDMNAYTSFDETVFYITMSARRKEVGLEVLADAASDPTFDEAELAREKEVVVEEISRAEDNPAQMVSENLFAKAYTLHPYRRPIAGTRETVRGISRGTLREFYRRWYVGSNLIFIGVGDFEAEAILQRVSSLFASIPAGSPPSQVIPTEPTQHQPCLVSRPMTIEGLYLDIGLPIPPFLHPDTPAIDLLSHILGGGASSRLEQEVREKRCLVTQISASAYTPRYPGLLITGAVLRDGNGQAVLRAIWEEMDRLRDQKVTPVELARARETIRSGRLYEKQTVDRLARKLGFFEGIANDLEAEETYYRRIQEVNEDDLLEIAGRYLNPSRLTLSLCHPKGRKFASLETTLQTLSPRPSTRPPSPQGVQRLVLKNGIRLLIRKNPSLPLVSLKGVSLGGLRTESPLQNGISHLVSLLVTKGTAHRAAREIAEEEENMAAHFDSFAGWNLIGLSGAFLAERLTEGIDLFTDLLLSPSFPEDEVKKEKEATLTAIRNQEDQLHYVTIKNFLASLYRRHPYGLPLLGNAGSVKRLTRGQLERHYRSALYPKNLVLAVSGDVDPADLHRRLEEKLGRWQVGGRAPRIPPFVPPSSPRETAHRRQEKFQAHLAFGFPGTTVRNRDRYPLDVLNAILAGQGGRLFLELRDRQGLAYAISSSSQEGIEPGYLMVYMGCDPAKLNQAAEGVKQELEKVRNSLVGEEELSRARRYLVGNYEIELQKNSAVAAILATNEIYGIGWRELFHYPEAIEKVTTEEVRRVAVKYLRPDRSVLSIVRP